MSQFTHVETSSGKIRGRIERGVHTFKGIPYGADTGGSARFMRPRSFPSWQGTRDALQYGAMCPQGGGAGSFDQTLIELLHGGFEIPALPPAENCLVLNIWTPQSGDHGRRPVMVWCHGGRFSEGSGGNPWCDGSALARLGDVVVVTLNHRLNLLGHTHLADLVHLIDAEDASYAASGNSGMLDIVAALEWVREHITQFGGDPQNVTLFGNSGGGAKINALMAMPLAQGLFHKAIVQSAPLRGASASRRHQHQVATALLAYLGLPPQRFGELKNISIERLQVAVAVIEARLHRALGMGVFTPVVDGNILPEHPFEHRAPSISKKIPLLIGTNADEMTLLLGNGAFTIERTQIPDFLQRWADIDRCQADHLLAVYSDLHPTLRPQDLLFTIATDHAMARSAIAQADMKSLQSAAVYMYRFQWRIPAHEGIYGATHGAEVPFVFANVDSAPGFQASHHQYRRLEQQISMAWVSFARSGDPNHAGLPHWPRYDSQRRRTLCFGSASDVDRQSCEVIDNSGLSVTSMRP